MYRRTLCKGGEGALATLMTLGVVYALADDAAAAAAKDRQPLLQAAVAANAPAEGEASSVFIAGSADAAGRRQALGGCPQTSCDAETCCVKDSPDESDAGTQLTCFASNGSTIPAGFARCFDLAAEGIAGDFSVDVVRFGVGHFVSPVSCNQVETQPIDINIYAAQGCPPTFNASVLLTTETVMLSPDDEGSEIFVPFPSSPTINAGEFLVVEIYQVNDGSDCGASGDDADNDFAFLPFANGTPACSDALLRFPVCGVIDWIGVSAFGFSDSQTVIVVSGHVDGGTPVACGDGVVSGCEECDDGNTEPGDGCDQNCNVSICTDLNGDGVVGPIDLAMLLATWGPCADPDACRADLNADGVVGPFDLATLLAAWGPCP